MTKHIAGNVTLMNIKTALNSLSDLETPGTITIQPIPQYAPIQYPEVIADKNKLTQNRRGRGFEIYVFA